MRRERRAEVLSHLKTHAQTFTFLSFGQKVDVCAWVFTLSGSGRPPYPVFASAICPLISSQLMKLDFTLFTMGGTSRDVCSRWTGRMEKNMAEKKKKPIGKIILIVVVVIIALGAFGSLSGGDKGSDSSASGGAAKTEQAEEKKQEQEPYTISDEALDTSNPYGVKITGTLVNNTDEDKSYLQIEYNLYDADGAQIGTALANISNLKAGGTWKFEAASMEKPEDVANWERVDVSGF